MIALAAAGSWAPPAALRMTAVGMLTARVPIAPAAEIAASCGSATRSVKMTRFGTMTHSPFGSTQLAVNRPQPLI